MNNISKKTIIISSIILGVILVAGLVLGIVLKFNTNFELGNYSEFTVSLDSTDKKVTSEAVDDVSTILNSYGLKYDITKINNSDEGTRLIVRYYGREKSITVAMINGEIKEKLALDSDDIDHYYYESTAPKTILFTGIVLGIIVVLFSVFVTIRYARYTGLVTLISSIVATALYLSITVIMRLSVGMSYFAVLILLNILIMYYEINMFESVNKGSRDQVAEISNAVINNRKSMSIVAVAIAVVSLLFVIIAPTSLKFISLGLMFVPVVGLAVGLYVAPFFFAVFAKAFYKGARPLKK